MATTATRRKRGNKPRWYPSYCYIALSLSLFPSAWRGIGIRLVGMSERRRGALQKPYHFLSCLCPCPRHALLISARTSAAHLPAQAIYAQANRQSLPEQALSLRLSVSFCSIPTKLNFKARGGCQPLDHYVVLPHTALFPALRLPLPHRNPQTSCWCQQILFICGSCCITTF